MSTPALRILPTPEPPPPPRPALVHPAATADALGGLRALVMSGLASLNAALRESASRILGCQNLEEVDRYAGALVDEHLAGPAARLTAVMRADTALVAELTQQSQALARRRDALPPLDLAAVQERRPWDAASRTSLVITIVIGIIACFSGGWNIASAVLGTAGYKGTWGFLPAGILGLMVCGAAALLAEMLHRVAVRDPNAFERRVRVVVGLLVAGVVTFALAYALGFADRRMGNVAALLTAAGRPTGSAWSALFCLSLLTIEMTVSLLAHIHLQHLLRSRHRGAPPKDPEWQALDEQVRGILARIGEAVRRHADAEGLLRTIAAARERASLDARGAWRRHRAQFGM